MCDIKNCEYEKKCWNERFSSLMDKHHLTQKRFAELIYACFGVRFSQKQISNWLHINESSSESSQKKLPTYENMKIIAKFFHCSVGYLTGETDAITFDHQKASDFLNLSLPTINSIKYATDEATAFSALQTVSSRSSLLYEKLLTSPHFYAFLRQLDELDEEYTRPSKAREQLDKLDNSLDPSIRNEVHELVQRGLDEGDPIPPQEILNHYHEINSAIDDCCAEDENKEYTVDVLKYRLLRAYNKMIDNLYPDLSN